MKATKSTLSLAIGSAFAASMIAVPAAHAENNPFAMQQLQSGYMVAAADTAAAPAKAAEGKCGGKKEGEMKAKDGKCGNKAKMKDGKCGEGKCGAGKKDAKAAPAKAADGKCGGKKADDMKAKEGKCGGAKKADDKAAAPAAK
jgi:uncharacterized low-complexity protein